MTKDEKGQIAEAGFVFLALLNRLVVWKPVNPQLRYDFIVEVRDTRFKVQVKSAWKANGSYRVDLLKKRRVGGVLLSKSYAVGDFDFLAVFNEDERDFWIFPAGIALPRTTILCRTVRSQRPSVFDPSTYWRSWGSFSGV